MSEISLFVELQIISVCIISLSTVIALGFRMITAIHMNLCTDFERENAVSFSEHGENDKIFTHKL